MAASLNALTYFNNLQQDPALSFEKELRNSIWVVPNMYDKLNLLLASAHWSKLP